MDDKDIDAILGRTKPALNKKASINANSVFILYGYGDGCFDSAGRRKFLGPFSTYKQAIDFGIMARPQLKEVIELTREEENDEGGYVSDTIDSEDWLLVLTKLANNPEMLLSDFYLTVSRQRALETLNNLSSEILDKYDHYTIVKIRRADR